MKPILALFLIVIIALPRYVSAQVLEFTMEANLMGSVVIDLEADFDVNFGTDFEGFAGFAGLEEVIAVKPNEDEGDKMLQPALVRVRGGTAEALVSLESTSIDFKGQDGGDEAEIYDFDIIDQGGGSSATIMPDSRKNFFLLSVGAKVKGASQSNFLTSVNIININYL